MKRGPVDRFRASRARKVGDILPATESVTPRYCKAGHLYEQLQPIREFRDPMLYCKRCGNVKRISLAEDVIRFDDVTDCR
jgi:hypothetical protein